MWGVGCVHVTMLGLKIIAVARHSERDIMELTVRQCWRCDLLMDRDASGGTIELVLQALWQ